MAYENEGPFTLVSGEALEADRLVKPSGTTAVYADAGDDSIGITEEAVAITTQVGIKPLNGVVRKVTGSKAIAAGAAIYAADDGKVSDAAVGKKIGTLLTAITADGGKGSAIVWGPSVIVGLKTEIADPGDAGAIPVTTNGTCPLVSAGAETRTLAIPTFAGQLLNLGFKTDAGDCVVTVASGVNQTGNNTLTFADAGDQLLLIAIENGAALAWRIVSNDGVGLTTV